MHRRTESEHNCTDGYIKACVNNEHILIVKEWHGFVFRKGIFTGHLPKACVLLSRVTRLPLWMELMN